VVASHTCVSGASDMSSGAPGNRESPTRRFTSPERRDSVESMKRSAMRRVLSAFVAATVAAAGLVATARVADAESGTFSVLTYNIAGLPDGISSAPTPRAEATTAIGQRIGPYDLVHVQEDFNYHATLYAADSHPYRTPTSGGAGIGSGLNTLSSLPYDADDVE